MSRVILIIILGFITYAEVHAQQQPVLSQYMLNQYYFNPAYTGQGELYNFSFLHRSQWSGYEDYTGEKGAPSTQLFTATANLDSTGHGFGLLLSRDKVGLLTTHQAEISYAYRIPLTKKSTLAMGFRGGVTSRSVNQSDYIIKHLDDPRIGEGKQTESKPDVTFGVWLTHEQYYVGVSAKGLITQADYETLGIQNEKIVMITAGYHIALSRVLKLTPSVQIMPHPTKSLIQGGAVAEYDHRVSAGLSYRHEEAVTLMVGFVFLEKKFRLGYAFDYITGDRKLKTGTSNEIMLSYRLGTLHARK